MSEERPRTPSFGRTVKLRQGYELHYLEHGAGSPVVFVHGSGPGVSAYSNFFPNYREIAAAGFRSVLPDLVGFGWSSKPSGIDYTLELFTSTLLEFLDQLQIGRCVLVGNSLGGAVSLKIAIDHPERVTRLVVMGPGGIESRERYFQMPGIQKMVSGFTGTGFDREGLRHARAPRL
jgi:4,5:9,10-diseco-3-hydroxy-5,9,17-trioxoandrosta-1(10),2-diene-4-oate hydrolase